MPSLSLLFISLSQHETIDELPTICPASIMYDDDILYNSQQNIDTASVLHHGGLVAAYFPKSHHKVRSRRAAYQPTPREHFASFDYQRYDTH